MNSSYDKLTRVLDEKLRVNASFDVIKRELTLKENRRSAMYFIDGFVKDEVTEKLMEFFLKSTLEDVKQNIPYVEVEHVDDNIDKLITAVLSGSTVYVVDGIDGAQIIDTRTYPTRGIEEPENDKVLRGSRDGFSETLIFNTALIRRRIRDPNLTMSIKSVGSYTKTDVVLCYVEGRADPKFVENISKKIEDIKIKALNFAEESLGECLIKRRWYNPFPKIRYTERPDAAAAMILEGSVIVIVDNSPAVMILPTSIFDFIQETNDYHLSPITGTYLRVLRIIVFLLTLFLTPVWYLLIRNPQVIPPWLEFIKITDEYAVPVIIQLFIIEMAIDGLKMASLNTPSMLTNSLSVVGGLILGDFAVKVGWFIPEVILYMAFVAIANFTQSSYELGYAFKFLRMMLLLLTAIFNLWGFIGGVVLIIVFTVTNKTVDGSRSYLYPIIPFNGQACKRLFFRVKLK